MLLPLRPAHTSRIELGTAVVPLQAQHPIALARQALSVHAITSGRLALGVGPSHHWIVRDMLGIPYEKPAAYTRDYLEVLNKALAGPGDVDVENDTFAVHNPAIKWEYMVRFAHTARGGQIGFHAIPFNNGRAMQTEAQLGEQVGIAVDREGRTGALRAPLSEGDRRVAVA